MRFKGLFPWSRTHHRKPGAWARQRGDVVVRKDGGRRLMLSALVGSLALSACGADPMRPQIGTIGFIDGFAGMVVADEPRAALVVRVN